MGGARGLRHVLIEAYQRFGDTVVERIAARLEEQQKLGRKTFGVELVRTVVAEVSGEPYDQFAARAVKHQQEQLARHRLTR